LALLLMGWVRCSMGEGTVGTNSTTVLLQALFGGGLVQITTGETLTPEIPLVIGTDTIMEGTVGGGRMATITGGGVRRIFQVLPGVRFEVRNLVLREGFASRGGGILNEGTLILSNVVLASCKATGPDGTAGRAGESRFGVGGNGTGGSSGQPGYGGAIYNGGELTVLDGIFTGNVAQGGNGGKGGDGGTGGWRNGIGGDGGSGAEGQGGAIYGVAGSTLSITNTLFVNNSAKAGNGGGGGSDSSVLGSGHGGGGASASGGAIHSAGSLWVVRSAFATNLVAGGKAAAAGAPAVSIGRDGASGGHALGGAITTWAVAGIVNSTFATNTVSGGEGGKGAAGTYTAGHGGDGGDGVGGAIFARGSLGVTNVTIAWNVVTNGLGGAGGTSAPRTTGSAGRASGSAIASDGATVDVVNSIIVAPGVLQTVDGNVLDRGYNLFSDRGTGVVVPGSVYSADPRLGEYKVWAELTTPGFMLLNGSPAIDGANAEWAPTVDQRGVVRASGRGPDIGAMESSLSSYYLGGTVYAGSTKQGVPGVGIETGELRTVTDDDGRFQFGPLPSGYYTVAIAGGGVGFQPRVMQVALVADTTDLVFRSLELVVNVQRQGTGSGVVLSATGLPSRTYRLEGTSRWGTWGVLHRGVSDSEGRIAFQHDPGNPTAWYYRMVQE